jgi:hypothetical protein
MKKGWISTDKSEKSTDKVRKNDEKVTEKQAIKSKQ